MKQYNIELRTFVAQVRRQFGDDAPMILLAPHKYSHHFDERTLPAYEEYINETS
jgi:hypothetical protein